MNRLKLAPLNLLRTFDSAGKYLSFKQAADELHITPPAVSYQIKTLEERIGLVLFERTKRALAFTEVGEKYWRFVHKTIDQLDQFTYELQNESDNLIIKLSVVPPVANNVIIPKLAEFQSLHPDITVQVDSDIKNVNIEAGDADIVIRFGEGHWPELVSEKILDLYVQPFYPAEFTQQYKMSAKQVNINLPLVHMMARKESWPLWFAHHGIEDVKPDKEYYLDDYPAAMEACKTLGGALALMPMEKHFLNSGQVIAPYPQMGPLPEGLYICTRTRDKDNDSIQQLVTWLKAQVIECYLTD